MESVINKENCYWEVTIECSSEDFELLSYCLFENKAEGVEEMSDDAHITTLRAFFSDLTVQPEHLVNSIYNSFEFSGQKPVIVSADKKPVENWQSNWKTFFKPLFIGDDFVIRPPWEDKIDGKKEIVIEPGLGFGTGYHESTRLAVHMLSSLGDLSGYGSAIDIGTGSGILVIAALLQGASNITAIDIDENSENEVPHNLELSGLNKNNCRVLTAETDQLLDSVDIVMANITADVILNLKDEIDRLTNQNGIIVLSGVFHEFYEEVKQTFSAKYQLINELNEGEWHSMAFKKA